MISVQASQFVYTSVNAAYSPDGAAGYQLVYRPAKVTSADQQSIVERVRARQAAPQRPSWQFFTTDGGYDILARTTDVEPEQDICDARGATLVHGLVFAPQELAKINYDVFRILDAFPALAGLSDMVARFGPSTAAIPSAPLNLGPPTAPDCDWQLESLGDLLALALHARRLVQSDGAISITGDSEQVERVLRIIFQLAPPAALQHCSFNTWSGGEPDVPGEFWAVGGAQPRRASRVLKVDSSSRRVDVGDTPRVRPDNSLYMTWLDQQLRTVQTSAEIVAPARIVWQLAAAIDDDRPVVDDLEPHADTCAEFYEFASDAVRDRLVVRFGELTTPDVAQAVDDAIPAWLAAGDVTPVSMVRVAAGPDFTPICATQWCERLLLQEPPRWRASDWQAIRALARAAGNARLLLLASVIPSATHEDDRLAALGAMSSTEFATMADDLPEQVPPELLLHASHAADLLCHARVQMLSEKPLARFIQAALEKPEARAHASLLAPLLPRLSPADATRCAKRVARLDGVDPAFVTAVRDVAAEAQTSSGWLGNLAFWRRPGERNND